MLKIRIKIKESEFEASGNNEDVTQNFQKFMNFMTSFSKQNSLNDGDVPSNQQGGLNPSPQDSTHPLPALRHIFLDDHQSSVLMYRTPLPDHETDADAIIMLLLGYHVLRHKNDVPVTSLTTALTRSSRPVFRLDRSLKTYCAEQFVVKRGRGKGGHYQLTRTGIKKASQKVRELAARLP